MKIPINLIRHTKKYNFFSTLGIITACIIPVIWLIIFIVWLTADKTTKKTRDYCYYIGIGTNILMIITITLMTIFLILKIIEVIPFIRLNNMITDMLHPLSH